MFGSPLFAGVNVFGMSCRFRNTVIKLFVCLLASVPLSNLGHNTQTPVWNDRPVTTPSKNMYTFSTDPYVPGVSERGIDFLQHKLDPVEFLQEILWPAIDLEFGTM